MLNRNRKGVFTVNPRKRITIVITAVMALVLLVFAVNVFLPQGRLSDILDGAESVTLSQDGRTRELAPGSDGFAALESLLDGYKWHRCFHSGDSPSFSQNSARVTLTVQTAQGAAELWLDGGKHLAADGKLLRLDYFGQKRARALYAALVQLLDAA